MGRQVGRIVELRLDEVTERLCQQKAYYSFKLYRTFIALVVQNRNTKCPAIT